MVQTSTNSTLQADRNINYQWAVYDNGILIGSIKGHTEDEARQNWIENCPKNYRPVKLNFKICW